MTLVMIQNNSGYLGELNLNELPDVIKSNIEDEKWRD